MASQSNNLSTDELLELVNRQKKQLQEMESAKKELTARVDFLQESLLRAREEASKSSTLESTATNLAEAKANLEKTVATLEVRLKNAENNLAELKERSAGVDKVYKEAERNQKRVEEQAQEMKLLEADLKVNKKEVERLKRELKLMTSNKDDVDIALKTASELAAARKEEITALRKNLKINEDKINLKEKSIAELNTEMEKLKKQLTTRQAENEELKRLRKNDAEMLNEYRKGKDLSETIALDNNKLKEELLVLNGRIAKTAAELRDKAEELDKLRKEMDRERTVSLAKEERNVELMSEISRLKQRNQQAEAQALKLSAELQESKLVQSQKNDDMKGVVAKARESEELTGKLNELEQKLKGQIEVSRQQEEQIARQNKSALEEKRKLDLASKELEEVRAKLASSNKEADTLKQKVTEMEIAALRNAESIKQLNTQIATLTTDSKNTSEALNLKLAKANAQIKSLTADLEKAQAADGSQEDSAAKKLQESQAEAQKLRNEVDTKQEKYNKTIQELTAKLQAQNEEIDRLVVKCASFELKLSDNEKRYKEQATELGKKADTEFQKLVEQQTTIRHLQDELTGAQKRLEDVEAEKKDLQAKLKDMEEDVKLLKAKTEVAEGLSLSLKDAEGKIHSLENENTSRGRMSDRAVKLMAEKESFYKKQMQEKDDLIDKLMSGSSNSEIWLTKIKQLNEKLEGEARRRMAVEAALVDMEDKLHAQEAKAKETAGKGSVAVVPAPVAAKGTEMELNVAREQQRRTVINGFLRQATESERQGKIEAARYNYQKALELDPENVVALQRMGIIAATLGNDPEAVKYLKQAFKLDTDNLDTLLALGYSQARLGQSDWAVSYLGRAVALNPENAYASRTYGAALFNMGWTEAAATRLLEAHRLKPDDPEAPFNLAVLYATAKQPDYQEASKWYKIAIKNGAQHDPGLDRVLGE